MPRILHIIDSLDYKGTASQLLVLAKGLASQKFDVHVCALDRRAPRLEEFAAAGISTTIVPRRFALDPLADWQLVRLVRRLRPEVIHTWDTVPGMLGPIAARRPFIAGMYRINRWKLPWEWAIERRFARRASRLITNSEAVRDWCVQNGLPAEKFAVISSGVGPARPSDLSREALLHHLSLPANAKLIGVVGRLVPEKRVKDLIWAADLLRVLHDNLRVLIIGDGPLRTQLEDYARSASDLDHICFLGEGNDLWRVLSHLDVLWNASENIGHSSAILEAMAAGVPVIASDTPTNRELIIDGETGYLIPIGTRAGRAARARSTDGIFADAGLAKQLGTAARGRSTQCFAAEQLLKMHMETYQTL
jgi:glycosyltransferase involved in cell wall biosynthesis